MERQVDLGAAKRRKQPAQARPPAATANVIDLSIDDDVIDLDNSDTNCMATVYLHGSSPTGSVPDGPNRPLLPVRKRHHSSATIAETSGASLQSIPQNFTQVHGNPVIPAPSAYYQRLLTFADKHWKRTSQTPKRQAARQLLYTAKQVHCDTAIHIAAVQL